MQVFVYFLLSSCRFFFPTSGSSSDVDVFAFSNCNFLLARVCFFLSAISFFKFSSPSSYSSPTQKSKSNYKNNTINKWMFDKPVFVLEAGLLPEP